jgi:phage protein D
MPDLGTTATFYAAQPTVLLDNQENAGLSGGLMALLVEETVAGLFRCEATFGNWGANNGQVGFLYLNRRALDFGKSLAIRVGPGDSAATIFEGRVMGLEARYPQTRPPELVVLAEDRFQDLRMTRRTRSFEDVSDDDVISQIASQHSLRTDIDINGPSYRVLTQVNQSDLAFLRERARAIDAEVWIVDDTLRAQARGRRQTGELSLTLGRGLIEFSVLADLAQQSSSLTVSGWDVSAKEAIEYEAGEAAISSELNGDQSGGSLLEEAIAPRAERLVHMVPLTGEEAQNLAEANYRRVARRFVTGRGMAEGDGNIRVGAHITLTGLGAMFNGEYYVTEARHTFDGQRGFRTHFAVERPGLGSD